MPTQHPAMRIHDLLNSKYSNVNVDDPAAPSPLFPSPQFIQATLDFSHTNPSSPSWAVQTHPLAPLHDNAAHNPPPPPPPPYSNHFTSHPLMSYPLHNLTLCEHVPSFTNSCDLSTTLMPTPQSTPPLQLLLPQQQQLNFNHFSQSTADSLLNNSPSLLPRDHRDHPPMLLHPSSTLVSNAPSPNWFQNSGPLLAPSHPGIGPVTHGMNHVSLDPPRAGSEPPLGGRTPSGRWSGGSGTPILLDLPLPRDSSSTYDPPAEKTSNFDCGATNPFAPPYDPSVMNAPEPRPVSGHGTDLPPNQSVKMEHAQHAHGFAPVNDPSTAPRHTIAEDGVIVVETTASMQRPFACAYCGRSFWRRYDCKRHMRVHTDERPYSCTGCQRSFARKDALNRHLQAAGCSAGSIVQAARRKKSVDSSLPPATSSSDPISDPSAPHDLTALNLEESWRAAAFRDPRIGSRNCSIRMAAVAMARADASSAALEPGSLQQQSPGNGLPPPTQSLQLVVTSTAGTTDASPIYSCNSSLLSPLQISHSPLGPGTNPLASPLVTDQFVASNPFARMGPLTPSVHSSFNLTTPAGTCNFSPVFVTNSPHASFASTNPYSPLSINPSPNSPLFVESPISPLFSFPVTTPTTYTNPAFHVASSDHPSSSDMYAAGRTPSWDAALVVPSMPVDQPGMADISPSSINSHDLANSVFPVNQFQ